MREMDERETLLYREVASAYRNYGTLAVGNRLSLVGTTDATRVAPRYDLGR